MEVLELPTVVRKRQVQVKPGEQLQLIRFGEGDVWAKAREALGWPVLFAAERAGFKTGKPIVALEAGQGTTKASSLLRLARALEVDPKQVRQFGRILETATATFQRGISMTTGEAPTDTEPHERSLAQADEVTHSHQRTQHGLTLNDKERALMENPKGRAVIALMAGFTTRQLNDLFKAASAIDERGINSPPKEGLSP